MFECSRCHGVGYEIEEDDYGNAMHFECFHCMGTGYVDKETNFSDRLMRVADWLALQEEMQYKKYCEEDPLGDGYDLHAAENMMTSSEYFCSRVLDRSYDIFQQLLDWPMADRELLVAWHEMPGPPKTKKIPPAPQKESFIDSPIDEDDIPF